MRLDRRLHGLECHPEQVLDGDAAAIAASTSDSAVKIAFQAKRRFWEEDDNIYGGISWTSLSDITQIWYPSNGYHGDKGVIIGSYILGAEVPDLGIDAARRFAAMSPAQRREAAIVAGERIHPGYRGELESDASIAWSEVPFQKGSWPVLTIR